MASAFSTNSEDAFTKTVEFQHEPNVKAEKIEDYFEIDKCVKFLKNGSFIRVALQFPDELLNHAFKVVKLLEEQCPKSKLYILGDTTYGSCCVDEIAAEHIAAECVIHFGRACLSKTRRLPVLFVFGKCLISPEDFCQKFMKTFKDNSAQVLLFYDVVYEHAISEIHDHLGKHYANLVVSKLATTSERCYSSRRSFGSCCTTSNCCRTEDAESAHQPGVNAAERCYCEGEPDQYPRFGRSFKSPSGTNIEDFFILYIGKESLTLTNLMMTYNRNKFFTYDPDKKAIRQETLNVNKALMRRYYLIQKAKEAKTIGIVAGTLGVADYMLIIEKLKRILKQAGKKHYTFMMGKPNVAKMANFLEIDIFVLVACPENSLIDSQEFFKPIITPFEVEIACTRQREWTGEYITDFREILSDDDISRRLEQSTIGSCDEEPEYSLISGNLIKNIDMDEKESREDSSDLVPRNQERALTSFGENSSAYFLQTRLWSGLEQKLGETAVVDVVEGRTGIAIGYTHEEDDDKSTRNQNLNE